MEQKDDFIGKRVNDVKKIFGLAERDFMALMLVFSLIANGYLGYLVVKTNSDLNAKIVEEVRRQVPQEVDRKVNEGLEPIKQGVNDIKDMAIEVKDKIRKDSLK